MARNGMKKNPVGRPNYWPDGLSPVSNPDRFRRLGHCLAEDWHRINHLARLVAERPQLWAEIEKALRRNE